MKRFITYIAAACVLTMPAISHAGAFGIDMGMPLSKLKVLETVETDGQVSIVTVAAPTPNSEFTDYMVVTSPSTGVCKISALSKFYNGDSDGAETKAAFAQLKAALTNKYGASTDTDHLNPGSIWTGPNEWASSVYKKDRTLSSYWGDEKTLPHDLADVILRASATNPNDPYLVLNYEFANFSSCKQQMDAKDNTGL